MKTHKPQRGEIVLIPLRGNSKRVGSMLAGEVTRVMKTGVYVQACGYIWDVSEVELMSPSGLMVPIHMKGPIIGFKEIDRRGWLRLVKPKNSIRDSRIKKTPKK